MGPDKHARTDGSVRSKNPDPSGGESGGRIGICEASVASIHKLAISPMVFVMRAAPEFNLALGIYVKNALKIVFLLHPQKSQSKKEPQRSLFKGVFVGLSIISEEIKIIKPY